MTQKILTKNEILSVADSATKTVEVQEWGGCVIIATLTGIERDEYEEMVSKRVRGVGENKTITDVKNLRVSLLQRCLVDEKGARLFTDRDLSELNKKNSQVISRLFDIAQTFNGLNEESLQEEVKN